MGAVTVIVAAFAVSLLRDHGRSAAPVIAPSVSPSVAVVASGPDTPLPTVSDSEPAISNISPSTALGSCFDLPAGRATITARFRPCSSEHQDQLVALERASGTDARYPDAAYWDGPVLARCNQDLVRYTGQPEQNWPPELRASALLPRRAGWALGDRVVYCLGEHDPARSGTVRHLPPFHPESVIGSSESHRPAVLTGDLVVTSPGNAVCLAVRRRDGSEVVVSSITGDFSWLAATRSDGSADTARSGIAIWSQPDVHNIVKHAGVRVTLTGRYSSPDLLGCGGTREFDFTGVR